MSIDSSMITKTFNADNVEYPVLRTPGDASFANIIRFNKPHEFEDGYKFYHLYISCNELKNKCLPLDANPREPTLGDVVSNMQATLRKEPQKFHHLNNGITIIASNVIFNAPDLTIYFNEGEGVCNGGHTYFSIVNTEGIIDESSFVHIEIIQLPTSLHGDDRRRVINDIAAKRNRNRALHPITQADYLGFYDPFKRFLGENSKFITWHEGDSDAHKESIKSDHFIRLLASIDPLWYRHRDYKAKNKPHCHRSAVTGVASTHNRWFQNTDNPEFNLYHLAPLCNDLLYLRDLIAFTFMHDSFADISGILRKTHFYSWATRDEEKRQLYHKLLYKKEGYKITPSLEVLLMGTFRNNIWLAYDKEDSLPRYVGYYTKIDDLWDCAKDLLLDKLKTLYQSFDNDNSQFVRQDAAFVEQLTDLYYGAKQPEHPCEFYDVRSGEYYVENHEDYDCFLETVKKPTLLFATLHNKEDVDEASYLIPFKKM